MDYREETAGDKRSLVVTFGSSNNSEMTG
jgi:hypothetical protein